MQNLIVNACNFGHLIHLRRFQKLIFNSISSRFKVIRNISYENSSFFSLKSGFHLTSFDKFLIVLSFPEFFSTYDFSSYFILKKKGSSFFFEIPYIFVRSLLVLSSMAVFPFFESYSDRNNFVYKPYRDYYYFILNLKKILSLKISKFWVAKFDIFSFISFPLSLLKSFPFDKKVLFYVFKAYSYPFSYNSSDNLLYIILNFTFTGLVF